MCPILAFKGRVYLLPKDVLITELRKELRFNQGWMQEDLCLVRFFPPRRIAYQESSKTFAVVTVRVDGPSKDKQGTFTPIRPRYNNIA